MIELTVEDVAKFHENIAKWLRNKEAARIYEKAPVYHTAPYPAPRHRNCFEFVRQADTELPQYGVEIELDLEFVTLMSLSELRLGLSASIHQAMCGEGLLDKGFGVQKDGSVSKGMEVVLPPLDLPTLKNVLKHLYKVHGMQYVRNHEACGVHITTDPFPDEASAVAFWNFWQNKVLTDGTLPGIASIIGRKPTRHCELQDEVSSIKQIKRICKSEDRGAVVLRDNGCMEVRVFASVVDAKKVFRQVQLVDAVYQLCIKYKSEVAVLYFVKKRFNKKSAIHKKAINNNPQTSF